MRLRLVSSPGANSFMRELLSVVADELPFASVVDAFGEIEGDVVFAFIPHEHRGELPSADHLARTVAIHTEQPGTVWSEQAIAIARRCGAVVDISEVGRIELARNGLSAELVQLGYSDRFVAPADSARNEDVVYLASANRRRDVWLSTALPWLEPHRCRLICAPVDLHNKPLQGMDKWSLLASSRLLLNIRSVRPPYFEWVRALEAISNGCVYVTEHGAGHGPLVPGEHFVGAAPQNLGPVCDALLRDPGRTERIARDALDFVRAELPMRAGAERLAEIAESLVGARCAPERVQETHPSTHLAEADPLPGPRLPDFTDPAAEPPPGVVPDAPELARRLRAKTFELRDLQRQRARERTDDPDRVDVLAEHGPPEGARTTVCIPLYDHAEHIEEAIASAAAQTVPVHVVVLDDGSTDHGADVGRRALAGAGTLLQHRVNKGLAAARNELLHHVTTPYALMLDADNTLYPHGAERLERALDADPAADFAFGLIAIERDGRPDGLLSHLGWHPDRLAASNWIDALALLRTDRGLSYTSDPRLHGWEDYDLWCTIAARGGHGAFVPQPVGTYRRSGTSMLSLSDLDQATMYGALQERHPSLLNRDAPHTPSTP